MPALRNGDSVAKYETHAVGGGEWSVEALDCYGGFIHEWVGLNGSRPGEEATDLWAEVKEWEAEICRPAYEYQEWLAPDGTAGSRSFFNREIEAGRLHGLIVKF